MPTGDVWSLYDDISKTALWSRLIEFSKRVWLRLASTQLSLPLSHHRVDSFHSDMLPRYHNVGAERANDYH